MSDRSSIQWVRSDAGAPGATWNPVTGCTQVTGSPGCDRCYALTFTERWRDVPGHYFERGFDVMMRAAQLQLPLRWRKPRRVFVNSLADLFHRQVPDTFIAAVWAVMSQAPQHSFLVLTKRPGRMRALLSSPAWAELVARTVVEGYAPIDGPIGERPFRLPLPNVLVGTSAEDQRWADVRLPVLLTTPAAARFVSAEPLLGPLTLQPWLPARRLGEKVGLDWVIAGGESGHGARPMHPHWPQQLRRECAEAGVPFFFKQWGAWRPYERGDQEAGHHTARVSAITESIIEPCGSGECSGSCPDGSPDGTVSVADPMLMTRVGKRQAGRVLDGQTYDETATCLSDEAAAVSAAAASRPSSRTRSGLS